MTHTFLYYLLCFAQNISGNVSQAPSRHKLKPGLKNCKNTLISQMETFLSKCKKMEGGGA